MIKLLVIDDEPGICEIIEKTFSYIGFSVYTATNSKKALALMEKEKPKIVFLDFLMPDVDGFELLRKIKKINSNIIIIMVTAKKDLDIQKKALELGVSEFISKPFSQNYLRDVVVDKIKLVLDQGGHMQMPCILIVDDEKDFRENLKNYISDRLECDVEEAGDGKEAIAKATSHSPDIVFLDIKMPGISGMDVIAKIKELSPQVKIIIISAWKSEEVVSKAIAMGAVDYLEKPVSLVVLGEKLKSNLISLGKLITKKT